MIGRNRPLGSDREEILHGNHVIAMLRNSENNTTPSGFRFFERIGSTIMSPLRGCEKIWLEPKDAAQLHLRMTG